MFLRHHMNGLLSLFAFFLLKSTIAKVTVFMYTLNLLEEIT